MRKLPNRALLFIRQRRVKQNSASRMWQNRGQCWRRLKFLHKAATTGNTYFFMKSSKPKIKLTPIILIIEWRHEVCFQKHLKLEAPHLTWNNNIVSLRRLLTFLWQTQKTDIISNPEIEPYTPTTIKTYLWSTAIIGPMKAQLLRNMNIYACIWA